jgi:hypothetical protein
LSRGRGTGFIREVKPLFNSPLVSLYFKGEELGLVLKRAKAPL